MITETHTHLSTHTTNNGLMGHTDLSPGLVASLCYTEHFNRAKQFETTFVDEYV